MPMRCTLLSFCLPFLLGWSVCLADEEQERQFFEARIRPVLIKHCYECHAQDADTVGGGLLLDSPQALRKGGESGTAIDPGDADGSLLLSALRYESLEMPPEGRLPESVIADFAKWIQSGALDPRSEPQGPAGVDHEPAPFDVDGRRDFWSFQRPVLHDAPSVFQDDWPRRKLDRFVLARLESMGLAPATEAEREVLARRVAFDLIGLPPPLELASEFVHSTAPDAYAQYVERLLAMPQFGERWARLWLDVARYAEDQAHIVGNNDSLFYPNAYLYRDWLIGAFNRDLPYDLFTKLQLAGDVIAPDAHDEHAALGFLGLGPKYYRRNAPEVMADEWEDRVDTVTRGFLGLTVACARCHDHKYDPIPTSDYYALAGVFASTEMFNQPLDPQADRKKPAKKASESMHVVREGKPRDIPVHIRGNALTPAKNVVPRHFLEVLSPPGAPVPLTEGSGRAQLAEAIASEQNPLTARVIVNRVWAEYFGQPLVSTPSNFGQLGGRPTHPQLLDDLAVRFMRSGWSLKWLHREIIHSATYRQSSIASAESLERDPTNQWLSRMRRRRLSVEMWRDAMLVAAGELRPELGGKSLEVSDPAAQRRSVYGHVSRLELNHMQQMFDFPDPNAHSARRSETTTPLQKLFLLNSPFITSRAKLFVARIHRDRPADEDAISFAYRTALAREPAVPERELATQFLQSDAHWEQFAQALLVSNEMLHLD